MPSTNGRTDLLNRLLRGELAAVQIYQQALEKVADVPGALELIQIANEHRDAADLLGQQVLARGGEPASSPDGFGVFAPAVEGTAKLPGNAAALAALKEGEEQGVKEYERALESKDLDTGLEAFILSSLLPGQRRHVVTLNRLISS